LVAHCRHGGIASAVAGYGCSSYMNCTMGTQLGTFLAASVVSIHWPVEWFIMAGATSQREVGAALGGLLGPPNPG